MNPPIWFLGAVCKLSKLMAQGPFMPSFWSNTISVGISRIVEVMGAMVTAFKKGIADVLVKMSIGLFLLGALNLYQRISPCSITRPTIVHHTKCQTPLS